MSAEQETSQAVGSTKSKDAAKASASQEPFSSNNVRLSIIEWAFTLVLLGVLFFWLPTLWEQVEPFEPGANYRTPYRLSYDYWMFDRFCRSAHSETLEQNEPKTFVLGDSVVWGHYVGQNETLSSYLNDLSGEPRYVNLGIDGIHPAALNGLVRYYGRPITDHDVILHCNLLWMSSKRHDLQITKEFSFNHPQLVPQFFPSLACYTESTSSKLSIVIGRYVPLYQWASHLRIAYFDDTDFCSWTMEHPYTNPLSAVTLELPSPDTLPTPDPDARPWREKEISQFAPDWVELSTSFQWKSFRQIVELLQERGNRVFVLVGPFNEEMLREPSRKTYQQRIAFIEKWLTENQVPHFVPSVLPSETYADASHPLASGYEILADRMLHDPSFVAFTKGTEK